MSNSNLREQLDAKHERNDQQRIGAVKRWASYLFQGENPAVYGGRESDSRLRKPPPLAHRIPAE